MERPHFTTQLTDVLGTQPIAVKSITTTGAAGGYYKVTLDKEVSAAEWPITFAGAQSVISVLAKPSDTVEAYFENTENSSGGRENWILFQ